MTSRHSTAVPSPSLTAENLDIPLCTIHHPSPMVTNLPTGNTTTTTTTLHHPIPLLCGRVPVHKNCPTDRILIHHLVGSSESPSPGDCHTSSHLLDAASGLFKCLLRLGDGHNELRLQHCTSSLTVLHIRYERLAESPGYRVQFLYILPGAEEETAGVPPERVASNLQRIELAGQLVQTLYAEKLPDHATFQPAFASSPFLVPHLSAAQLRSDSPDSLWRRLAVEILLAERRRPPTPAGHRLKYVAVVECGAASGQRVSGLGAGDMCLLCVPRLTDWPQQLQQVVAAWRGDGQFGSALGALAHEMGHMFGLGHTRHGLMGDGVDYVARVFSAGCGTVWAPERSVVPCAAPAVAEAGGGQKLNRLTAIRRRPVGLQMLQQYRQQRQLDPADDCTWFARCSEAVLLGSRWIRRTTADEAETNSVSLVAAEAGKHLQFNWDSRWVSCGPEHQLYVIELRGAGNHLMLAWWRMAEDVRRFRVPVGEDGRVEEGVAEDSRDVEKATPCEWSQVEEVFAMDRCGNSRLFCRDPEKRGTIHG